MTVCSMKEMKRGNGKGAILGRVTREGLPGQVTLGLRWKEEEEPALG